MEEKRIYKISIESTPQNQGEIFIDNFLTHCAYDFKPTDAYIMIDKVFGIRNNIDVMSLNIHCNGLKDVYAQYDGDTNLKNSHSLDIIPAVQIRNVANANITNAYFNILNQLDNWRHISINELNNLHISVYGLDAGFPNGVDFNLFIVLKIKLLRKN